VQVVEHDLFELLVHLLLFPQNHIPLSLNRGLLQLAILQNVANNVDTLLHVLAKALGIIHRLFARGVSIEVGAEVLDLEFQGVLRTAVGALEGHVFEEVSCPVGFVGFGARTGVDPDAYSGGLGGGVSLGGHCQTIGEGGDLGEGTEPAGGGCCCSESALQRRGALFFRCGSVGWIATTTTRATYGETSRAPGEDTAEEYPGDHYWGIIF
jgi:hypothetical protein